MHVPRCKFQVLQLLIISKSADQDFVANELLMHWHESQYDSIPTPTETK